MIFLSVFRKPFFCTEAARGDADSADSDGALSFRKALFPAHLFRHRLSLSLSLSLPFSKTNERTNKQKNQPTNQPTNKTKTALAARGPNWKAALASWTCPSGGGGGPGSCDPCGTDFWGTWSGIGCRGAGVSSQDRRGGDGRVTNLHFTKSGGEGPDLPVAEFCALGGSVKEFDLTVGETGGAATPSPPVSTLPAAIATW